MPPPELDDATTLAFARIAAAHRELSYSGMVLPSPDYLPLPTGQWQYAPYDPYSLDSPLGYELPLDPLNPSSDWPSLDPIYGGPAPQRGTGDTAHTLPSVDEFLVREANERQRGGGRGVPGKF